MVHLIMPMGGAGSRFKRNGYSIPKPLIKIKEKPFLYWATISILKYVEVCDLTYVVLQQHIDQFGIDSAILSYFPDAIIKVLPSVLPGPAFTCLKGIEDINDDKPIVFNDCDHMFFSRQLNSKLNEGFRESGLLVCFESESPQFSYVQYDTNGKILGTIEKKVVSKHAICGAYVFKNAQIFRDAAREYTENCPYNECFVSGVYNVMCKNQMSVADILLDYHVEFGTPEEYEVAKFSRFFNDLR